MTAAPREPSSSWSGPDSGGEQPQRDVIGVHLQRQLWPLGANVTPSSREPLPDLQLQDHGVFVLLEGRHVQPPLVLLQFLWKAHDSSPASGSDPEVDLQLTSNSTCLLSASLTAWLTWFRIFLQHSPALLTFSFSSPSSAGPQTDMSDSGPAPGRLHTCAVLPVYLAMLSRSSGYLVTLCISTGMMSLSCSRRHRRLLSASWGRSQEEQVRASAIAIGGAKYGGSPGDPIRL